MRIRSLKPDYFDDRVTGRWPDDLKLFYAGLWCFADDHGRFEWEPDLIRCKLYPYEPDRDVDALLVRLWTSGRIRKYQADGVMFGFIPTFNDHQHPDKPKPSKIPAIEEGCEVDPLVPDSSLTRPRPVTAGREGKGEESPGAGTAPATPSLPPPSLPTAVSPSGPDTQPTPPPVAVSETPPAAGTAEPAWQRVLLPWERHCVPVGFARPRGTAKQRKEAQTRCRDPAWFDAYESACRFLARTPFYRGKNDRGWTATISWVMQPGKAEELAEKSETTKAPKGTVDAESASIHQAFLDAEREFETGAADRGDGGRRPGRGSESVLRAAPPSLPLPADGEGMPADVLSLLGHRRPAGALQDAPHVDDGDEHGAAPVPGALRVPGVDAR